MITEKRAKILDDKFFEVSFRDIELDRAFFDSIDKPVELHYIADNHNWDDGVEVLQWIVENKICDAATAKLIFWRSDPKYFLNDRESSDEKILTTTIIANFQRDFYQNKNFGYDPEFDAFARYSKNLNIPAVLEQPSKGKDLFPSFQKEFNYRQKVDIDVLVTPKEVKFITSNNECLMLHSEEWKLIDSAVYPRYLENFHFPKDLQKRYGVKEDQFKKTLKPPLAVFENKSHFAICTAFNRAALVDDKTKVNPSNLIRYEVDYLNAFIELEKKWNYGTNPKRMRICSRNAALSPPLIFYQHKSKDVSNVQLFYLELEYLYFVVVFIGGGLNSENIADQFIMDFQEACT